MDGDFAAWRASHIATRAIHELDAWAAHDPEAVGWACYDWLQMNGAGMPMLSLVDGNAREDARFWVETAHPGELECYALAAVDRLGGMSGGYALFASRQIKRLAGALFRRMSPEEQKAFTAWAAKQTEDRGK